MLVLLNIDSITNIGVRPMVQHLSTVTQKGQVTIPGPLRKALNIKPRDLVESSLVDGEVRLRPAKSAVLTSYGSVKPLKPASTPTDYRRLRREIEEEIADEVASKG